MFGFGKKEVKAPDERLADLQRKKDWAGVSRTYYELGVTAMDVGDLHKAHLWLHRADTIYSADDNIYDKVGEKLMDDCSDRIGRLEDEDGLFYNAIPAEIEARAEELSDPQVRVWGLLSIARLVRLGERLARLPGCEVLGQLDWAVDLMFRSLQSLPSQEAYQRLMDMCNALYELNGKPVYYSGEIEIPGKAPFQLFDLNGLFGVEQELNGYTDSHLRLLAALSQGMEELPQAERQSSWPAPCCPTTTSAPAQTGWGMSLRSRRNSSVSGATMILSVTALPGRRPGKESRIINSWIF